MEWGLAIPAPGSVSLSVFRLRVGGTEVQLFSGPPDPILAGEWKSRLLALGQPREIHSLERS